MFESYSDRARRVIFLARLESGTRGAEMIDVDDLLAALIIEDQSQITDTLSAMLGTSGTFVGHQEHQPFLPSEVTTTVLAAIQQSPPRSEAIPESTDMPISPALSETLAAASELRERLQSKEVRPLHLFAAVLGQKSKGAQLLRDAGITEERIVDEIRREDAF
ncbi:MAG: hypothetical protein C5B55_07470 [Blastocatellia bacterium]|nr:MAG: hypothetical protein C5B55_07470 [Blastocatellia bacterium]